jgi:hypothetical protein
MKRRKDFNEPVKESLSQQNEISSTRIQYAENYEQDKLGTSFGVVGML